MVDEDITYSKKDIIVKPDGDQITRKSIVNNAENFYESAYQEKLTDICDFSEGSEIRTLHESFSVELFSLYKEAYRMAKMKFVLDSEGTYLDRLGCEYHLSRHHEQQATGVVTFSTNETIIDKIEISAGTTILSRYEGYEYVLIDNVKLTSSGTPVEGRVRSKLAGARYNIGEGNLTAFQDISSFRRNVKVTNNSPITGGEDAETDLEFKKRILMAKRQKSWGTAPTYALDIIETVEGVHDVQFVDPTVLKTDEKYPAHYKAGVNETALEKEVFSTRIKSYCTACTRVLFVNGNMKPCDDDTLDEVNYFVTQQNNLVVGHNFHVQEAEIIPVFFAMSLFCTSLVSEETVYDHLTAFFDGDVVEGKGGSIQYQGVNIGETVYKNQLLNVIENIPGVEQCGTLYHLKYDDTLTNENNWIDHGDNTYSYTDDEGYTFVRGTKSEEGINYWGWTNFTKLECYPGQVFQCRAMKGVDSKTSSIFDFDLNIIDWEVVK